MAVFCLLEDYLIMNIDKLKNVAHKLKKFESELSDNQSTLYNPTKDKINQYISEIRKICDEIETDLFSGVSTDEIRNGQSFTNLEGLKCIVTSLRCKSSYYELVELQNLLATWIECKFIAPGSPPSRKYCKLPSWIASIVIYYGYCMKNNIESFSSEFISWCNDPKYSKYIVPKAVYDLNKSIQPTYATLHSLVLWDMIADNINILDKSLIISWFATVDNLDPEIDEYVPYTIDKSIVSRCNFHIVHE